MGRTAEQYGYVGNAGSYATWYLGVIMEFSHVSVLLNECIEGLDIKPDGIYVDCTVGGAGHSIEIAKRLGENGKLIGLDRDPDAV